MKNNLGQIIFNAITALAGVIIIGATGMINYPAAAILFIILLMFILSAGNYYFIKLANSGKKAFQPSYVLTEQTFDSLNEPKDYLDVMKDLKDYPPCRLEAIRMLDQWNNFQKKSETLNTISSSGGVYELANQDIESVMLNNMVLFLKRAAIMQSSSQNSEINMHKAYLGELIRRNDKILKDYTDLLIEASQLTGDDVNGAEIKSLNTIIDSIREYRKEMENGDENE